MKAFLRPHRFRHLYPVRFYTTKVISGHLQNVLAMSAFPPKADIGTQPLNVRFVPKADIP